ncbi:MAG: HEAT repeat domain-containing protein [Planctomycetes bacterium]|nr:HEAT repeat domain-containing protein [Planctomycetota bacterium]
MTCIREEMPLRHTIVTTLILVLALAASLAAQADSAQAKAALAEFKIYWKNENEFVRKAAIEELWATDHLFVTRQLLACLNDPSDVVVASATIGLGMQRNKLGVTELIQKMWRGRKRLERLAIIEAFKHSVPQQAYSAVLDLADDKDWEIRANGCELVARYNDHEGQGLGAVLPLAKDREALVRLAAMDAIVLLRNSRGHTAGLEGLKDRDWRVRAASIKICRQYRRKSSIDPLIALLKDEHGRLVDDAAAALRDICDRDIPGDHERWTKWWTRAKDRFKVPTAAEVAERKRKESVRRVGYDPPRQSDYPPYHGIKTRSRRILFVIDISTSMADNLTIDHENREAVEEFRKRYGDLDQTKIEIARNELIDMVEGLKSFAKFNIITFNSKAHSWRKTMVKATGGNKSKAIKMLARLTPATVAPTGGLRRAGTIQGRTNTFEALNACFGVFTGDEVDKKAFKTEADTVFFLSDGNPSTGRITQPQALTDYVATVNKRARLVIHTVSFGNANKQLMAIIAQQSGGQFVMIGN